MSSEIIPFRHPLRPASSQARGAERSDRDETKNPDLDARLLAALMAPIAGMPPAGTAPSGEWNAVCRSMAALRIDPCPQLVWRVNGQFGTWLAAIGIGAAHARALMRAADRRLCDKYLGDTT